MTVEISPNTKVVLDESEMPTKWYNLNADFPEPCAPHLHPVTQEPVTEADLQPLFSAELCHQELTKDRYVEIPEPIRRLYTQWRPSPLYRARRLEEALGTSARIYYKYEGVSPVGSHKTNTALPQAYYNKIEGIEHLTTETGAGQWGAALSYAGAMFDIDVQVWQVRTSYESKPYRRMLMDLYGGRCYSSPTMDTKAGRAMNEKFPGTTGSLGMAISEAVEVALGDEKTHYTLGSVLNHVMLHQTVIGEETLLQLKKFGEEQADYVFGCAGGGSNLAGLSFPFIREIIAGNCTTKVVAVEPASCPSMTEGDFRYDFGDVAQTTPLMKMYTMGADFVPDPIHAGGLRYHGMAPMVSHAYHLGLMDAMALPQETTFKAGRLLARTEGIVPAPESTHALAGALLEARKHQGTPGSGPSIVIGLSGHGLLDMPSYAQVGMLESF